MIRVLIVAAYASVRAGLDSLLAGEEGIEVIAAASGSAEAERLLPDARPDVVLADDLPGDRARLLSVLTGGDAALVLLSAGRDGLGVLASAPLSGWGFLRPEADGTEIAAAVRAAAAGLVVLDRSLAPGLTAGASPPAGAEGGRAIAPGDMLTAREREVLALMAHGLMNKQIAARLAISPHTVKFHVASVLAKLGAASRTEAVTLGARRGMVSL